MNARSEICDMLLSKSENKFNELVDQKSYPDEESSLKKRQVIFQDEIIFYGSDRNFVLTFKISRRGPSLLLIVLNNFSSKFRLAFRE